MEENSSKKQIFKPIDIVELVRSKSPKLAKRLPKFIYRYFKKVLHLDEINTFMSQYGDLEGIPFIDEIIKMIDAKFELQGVENLPKEGRHIFVSNHPLGGLDGVLIIKHIGELQGHVKCLVNDFLMLVYPLKNEFVPINKFGGQAKNSIFKIDQMYESQDQILIFPAGLCSRKIKGKITDLEWQKHFIQKSIQYKLDVVPIFFEGHNSKFFYRLANLRKFLKIKLNIEMLYLPNELYKQRGNTFKIHFGQSIPYTTFDNSRTPKEWAAYVKDIAYNLPRK